MSILILGPLPNPIDGCSIANETLRNNLLRKEIRHDTINTSTKKVSSKQGSVFSFKKAFGFFSVYFQIYKVYKSKVVYITPGQTFFGLLKYAPFYLLCILLNKPYVIHVHGNHLGKEYQSLQGLKKKIFKLFVSNAKAGIVLSQSLRKIFKDLLPEECVFVVENFASDELFENYEPALKERSVPKILFLSNLIAEKGVIDVLEALLLLKEQNISFEALFAGKIEEEFKNQIYGLLNELGEAAQYLGVIKGKQKHQVLNSTNIFILPTYYKMEGQPISILEAMATGNIIVTTNHAGIPDVVSEQNGYFVDKKSPVGIATVIREISEDVRSKLNFFEQTNITYAANRFTEEAFSSKIINILQSLNDS